jgi:hypothetical protein
MAVSTVCAWLGIQTEASSRARKIKGNLFIALNILLIMQVSLGKIL